MNLTEIRENHWDAILGVVVAAFGQPDEADLVRQLRADGAAILELGAFENEKLLGHVLFSELIVEPMGPRIAALAPISVAPERQRQGIGSALICKGLTRCAEMGFDAVAVLGDTDYYGRFGFTLKAAEVLRSEYSGAHYQALALKPGALSGGVWQVTYPKAFG